MSPQNRTGTPTPLGSPSYGVRDTDHYGALEAYYGGVRVYEALNRHMREGRSGGAYSALKALRNPAESAVEFHQAVLWGGRPSELELEGPKPVADRVKDVWKWSNLDETGKVTARMFPLHGDYLEKVAKPDGRPQVIKQRIDPKHMTDFDKDDRGFFTYLRLDIPSERRKEDGTVEEYLHTEVWRKGRTLSNGESSDGYFRYWEREKGASVEDNEERMGDPTGGAVLSENGTPSEDGTTNLGILGFDFIPFVHAKFRDTGRPRGVGVFAPHTEDIDEANRIATRLHEMFFRYDRPYKGIKSVGTDATGAPMPQPRADAASRQTQREGYAAAGYGTEPDRPDEIELGGEKMALFPANAEPVDLTPRVDYDAGIRMLENQLTWLSERMPELLYTKLQQKGEMSGVALRTILGPAVDRAKEARENLEAAMVRGNEMALTIGKIHNLEGFTDLGEYEKGDLSHSFKERPVLSASEEDELDREAKLIDVLGKLKALGADPAELLSRAGVKAAPQVPQEPVSGAALPSEGTDGGSEGADQADTGGAA